MKSNETKADRDAVLDWSDGVHDALNRMKRACDRGTGCHLTAGMVSSLALSVVGSLWNEEDPRKKSTST